MRTTSKEAEKPKGSGDAQKKIDGGEDGGNNRASENLPLSDDENEDDDELISESTAHVDPYAAPNETGTVDREENTVEKQVREAYEDENRRLKRKRELEELAIASAVSILCIEQSRLYNSS